MSGMSEADEMTAAASGVKLTYDDFVRFPDDGKRHELIDGEHYVTPSPNTRHQRISGRLHLAIGGWLETHQVGQLFYAPYDIVISRFDIVEPDLVYFSNARAAELLTTLHATGAPELVIEIGSPGTRRRDETIKLRLYERAGVVEYWFVDPAKDRVRVYRKTGDLFGAPATLSGKAGDVLATPLLTGLELPLAPIFRD